MDFRKFTSFALTSAMLFSLASCGESSENNTAKSGENVLVGDNIGKGVNVSEEDMPFGATMTDLYTEDGEVQICISYENRYITKEEAIKLSDYVSAVNSKDAELMEKTCYKPYLDYIVSNYGNKSTEEYLTARHDEIRDSYAGEEYDIDYIITNALHTEDEDNSVTGFDELDAKLKELSPDIQITDRKLVEVDILYRVSDGEFSLSKKTGSDTKLYLYTIDGQMYVL